MLYMFLSRHYNPDGNLKRSVVRKSTVSLKQFRAVEYTVERKVRLLCLTIVVVVLLILPVFDFSTAEIFAPEISEGRIGQITREPELNRKKWVCKGSKGRREIGAKIVTKIENPPKRVPRTSSE